MSMPVLLGCALVWVQRKVNGMVVRNDVWRTKAFTTWKLEFGKKNSWGEQELPIRIQDVSKRPPLKLSRL